MKYVIGVLIPFFGTSLGAACVFFMKKQIKPRVQQTVLGIASGVMIAASIWSLLMPCIDMSGHLGKLAFLPAAIGFTLGMAFLILIDKIVPYFCLMPECEDCEQRQDFLKPKKTKQTVFSKTKMLLLAVTIHNVPEGMAVGVVFAGVLNNSSQVTFAGAMALAIGIAIQNFPEGAIISMPLKADGSSKKQAFIYGMLSGIVEPIAAFITILLAEIVTPVLPYFLSFAAGAMLYVVIEELVPEAKQDDKTKLGTIGFTIGFLVMMILDVTLG
ncbi:ZIP family metal transporter [[Clostridium] polysaccharolyticum]|jgi:ZIP family zinc transporter|uniref:Zinc transporter, ZIP family n=1 Tax=[Clostridium] polysaccharolyticum TaxID=29364 RepID=A0A1I0B8T5_9FIRM|nr:ZIP family metal transporter [[Clostridium] polysaccharolyticum]SET03198.1 zinc transporter, ZIP family [[Clostridium] polysaccharolyticum]